MSDIGKQCAPTPHLWTPAARTARLHGRVAPARYRKAELLREVEETTPAAGQRFGGLTRRAKALYGA